MRFSAPIYSDRKGTLAGLSGVPGAAFGIADAAKLRTVSKATYPRVTLSSLPDNLIFENPKEYLRQALNGANWDLVARWYATKIQQILNNTTNASAFFELSQMDLQVYCERKLGIGDLKALTEKCIYSFVVSDLGKKAGFGTNKRLPQLTGQLDPNVGGFFSALLYGNYAGYYKTLEAVKNVGDTSAEGIVSIAAPPPIVDTYTLPQFEAPPIYVLPTPVYVDPRPVGYVKNDKQLRLEYVFESCANCTYDEALMAAGLPANYDQARDGYSAPTPAYVDEPGAYRAPKTPVSTPVYVDSNDFYFNNPASLVVINKLRARGLSDQTIRAYLTAEFDLQQIYDLNLSGGKGLSGLSGLSDIPGARNYRFCLGWVPEPDKHTASRIMVAVGAAFIGAAAFQAAFAGAAAPITSTASAAAGSGVATGVAAPVITAALATPVIETVIVTAVAPAVISASAIGAGIATGIAAGAAIGSAAPVAAPISAQPQPIFQASPVIETVTTTASALPSVSVAQAIATGAIATAAAAPALLAPTISSPIETVVVEGARPVEIPVDAEVAALIGSNVIQASLPEAQLPDAPEAPEYDDTFDKLKGELKDAALEFGADKLKELLAQKLRDKLNREASQAEILMFEDYIDSLPQVAPSSPGLIDNESLKSLAIVIGIVVVAILATKKSRKKRARRQRNR